MLTKSRLTKSRRTLAASALLLAVAGGGSVALVRLTAAPAPTLVAPAALPSTAGPAVTAAVPRGPGQPEGTGAGNRGGGGPASANGSAAVAGTASGQGGAGSPSPGAAPAAGSVPAATAGGAPGSEVPADGAVPGASPALRALAAARAATTALPHSPRLLAALAGPPATGPPAAGPSSQPAAAARALAGLDVAGFQHPVSAAYPGGRSINWASVGAAGYKFAAVKATEGDYYVNPWAATDLTAAKAAGLDVTPYHFAVPDASGGADQAKFAVQYSGYASGTRMLPLLLDIEYDPYVSTDHTNECYGLSPAKMTAWLSAFVATVKSLTGQSPVIYTTADWWNTCTGRSAAFTADPLWVAAYGPASPPRPAGWPSWTFWQYSSSGAVPGVGTAGGTDLDQFAAGAVGLVNPGSQSARARARASLQLGALGGGPLSYTASGLPPGLAVRPGGLVSGTVAASAASTAAVTYRVTVTARNGAGATGTVSFSWRVTPA